MPEETVEEVIRVLVADDTRLHTQLLADALRRDSEFEVIGSDSQALIGRVNLHNIDVFLISSDLDGQPSRGFEVLREVRVSHPDVHAVMLLDSSNPNFVLEAFRAGSRGVLGRHESVETLSKCVRRVHQGQVWANSQQMSLVVQSLVSSHNLCTINAAGMDQLSKREIEIVESVAQGLSNRKIAERLGLSQHTVKNYLFRVFEKLGVSSRVELLSKTFHQIRQSEPAIGPFRKSNTDHDLLNDAALLECQKAAEQGVPSEQLKLAQFYWTRRTDSNDLIQAYKWYSIANQQILRTSKRVGKAMTLEQIFKAEQMATEWLRKASKLLPGSTRDELIAPPKARPRAIPG